ncbi:MAG: glycosyltransferase [Candidatus Levybacteria bacterium]|nr:glycosyltransferase [Candidatus Levybacteria bacterium]
MKKVLFVTYDFPYPTNTGGKNRAYHMLKHSGQDLKKYLFSFVRDGSWRNSVVEMEKIGVEVVETVVRRKVNDPKNILGLFGGNSIFKTLYYSEPVANDLLRIIHEKEIDIVHFESFYTAFYISDEIRGLGVKQVFGTENIEYQVYREHVKNANFLLKPLFRFQADKIREEEISLLKKADLCIAVSDADATIIKKYVDECEVIRNGVDIDEFKFNSPKAKKGTKLLFVGNFTYFPNVDAINFFYNEIFKNLPGDIRLTIIGKKVKTLKFGDFRIEKKDFTPRIQDAYEESDLVVAPVRLGGGTNFKVLEAMASGCPVVSLPDRLEGLDLSNNKHIVIAKEEDFAQKIVSLLNDLELRKKLAKNARELVEHEYSWRVIGNNLNTVWNNL